jgi:hypothetical protein
LLLIAAPGELDSGECPDQFFNQQDTLTAIRGPTQSSISVLVVTADQTERALAGLQHILVHSLELEK